MDREALLTLRRQVRRDDAISDGASRLFGEILDLHQMERGCIAGDKTFAEYLSTTTRTIRRRRRELEASDYLREERRDGHRHLVPTTPPEVQEPDNSVRSTSEETGQFCPDRTILSGQNCPPPDNSVRSEPDNSVHHRELDITPVGAESESAHPREASAEVEVTSGDPVDIYTEVTDCNCPIYYQEQIEARVDEDRASLALWEAICMRWSDASQDPERRWDPRKVPNLLDAYEQESNDLHQPDAIESDELSQAQRLYQIAHSA